MKISVCGKGGSGKSVITTLLANGIRDRGYHVLVVDADESNAGLHRMLGFDSSPVPILELVGGKQEVKNVFPKNPPQKSGPESGIIARNEIALDDLPQQYIFTKDGISFVSIGKIIHALEGCACPMGVLGREFLNKLKLEGGTQTIVDMEAGVEHFGRGVETSIDSVIVIVDPSYESIQLADKVKSMVTGIGLNKARAILNKITTDEMASRLRNELSKRNIDTVGCIRHDQDIFEACFEGQPVKSNMNSREIKAILDSVLGDVGQ